jgi:hypothetical protein
MTNTAEKKPSRKIEPWGIGIAIVLGVFVLALVGFVIFASLQSRDLVETSYYERGLEYGDRIDELERTQPANTPTLSLNEAARQLTLRFPLDSSSSDLPTGELQLYRPSNASWDQHYELVLDIDGEQSFELSGLPNGVWKAKVSWMLEGETYYHEESLYLP